MTDIGIRWPLITCLILETSIAVVFICIRLQVSPSHQHYLLSQTAPRWESRLGFVVGSCMEDVPPTVRSTSSGWIFPKS